MTFNWINLRYFMSKIDYINKWNRYQKKNYKFWKK